MHETSVHGWAGRRYVSWTGPIIGTWTLCAYVVSLKEEKVHFISNIFGNCGFPAGCRSCEEEDVAWLLLRWFASVRHYVVRDGC